MASNSSRRRTVEREAPETPAISAETRRTMIEEAAYYRSQRRAAAGAAADDVQDWLDAEQAVDQQIAAATAVHHQHGK